MFELFIHKTFAKLRKVLSKNVPRAPDPPKELPRGIQEAPKTPTWSTKAAQDAQVRGPRALKDLNLEAQNTLRPSFGGPDRFKDSTWSPKARQDPNLEAPSLPSWTPRALHGLNLKAQSAPRPQLGSAKLAKIRLFQQPHLGKSNASRDLH